MVEHNQSQYYGNQYKFNGKELDVATGMYYYGARYYDPRLSIFISVDPLAEKFYNWTPYNYTLNNPVNYVDPDGRYPIVPVLVGITKSVATEIANQVIGAATSYYINNSNSLSGFKFDVGSLDYKAISIAAGEGVVNGLNPSNWVKYTYKGGKVIFNSANDANIGLTEDKNKGTISFFNMFDSKNEKYAKDFFSSLIFNALDEFILDDLQENFSKDLSNKEVKQEIIRFMVEKVDDVLFEVMDEVLDKTIGGNTDKIKQSGSVD